MKSSRKFCRNFGNNYSNFVKIIKNKKNFEDTIKNNFFFGMWRFLTVN